MNRVEVSTKIWEYLFLHVLYITSVNNLLSFEPFVLPTQSAIRKVREQLEV